MHTVYLVDDDQIVLDKYWARRRLFFENGFEITGAKTNPLEALEEISATRPDAVFSDLKMPELSGIELMEKLSGSTFRPHFVIVSAHSDHKEVRKLFLSHGFDYIVKPVSDSDLVDLLSRLATRIDYVTPGAEKQTQSLRFNEILQYIKDYHAMNLTLDTVASHFDITPKSVCRLFSDHLQTTFSTHLNALRMEHAEKLLRTTLKPVKEIAISCGYGDPLYFARVFHKTRGVSPTSFREAEYGKQE
ncbi:MAG: helix-turn-helix domain-containing protein [Clostridiales bacterium]|jgi:two-component system response regulator YesN|nr:helix-turn-helix domain-containing protein [Clostridiales bacterium]